MQDQDRRTQGSTQQHPVTDEREQVLTGKAVTRGDAPADQVAQYVEAPAAREAFFAEQAIAALREVEPQTVEEYAYVGELVRTRADQTNHPGKHVSGPHAHGLAVERRAELRGRFGACYEARA